MRGDTSPPTQEEWNVQARLLSRLTAERDALTQKVADLCAVLTAVEAERDTARAERDEAREDADCAREWEQVSISAAKASYRAATAALAERDAARAEAARLREALEACAANIEETGEWGMDALAKTRVALAPPTDQGEGAP